MKTEKVIISKYLADFVKSLDGKIRFSKESEYLVSFEIPRKEWIELFHKTIKSGNNPFQLYSWSQNISTGVYD